MVYGKTNLPHLGMDTQSFDALHGQTNNPWHLPVTTGGSSGAAGLVGLEIGTDIGGSIRIPTHFCGIYRHESSYGIVSNRGAAKPWTVARAAYPPDIDLVVNGSLARSAKDPAPAMGVIVPGVPAIGVQVDTLQSGPPKPFIASCRR